MRRQILTAKSGISNHAAAGICDEDVYKRQGLGNAFDGQNFIADLTVRTEIDIRVFTAGRTDLVELNLFQMCIRDSVSDGQQV